MSPESPDSFDMNYKNTSEQVRRHINANYKNNDHNLLKSEAAHLQYNIKHSQPDQSSFVTPATAFHCQELTGHGMKRWSQREQPSSALRLFSLLNELR